MKGPTNSSARPNIRLLNVSATFDDNPDTSNNTEFPYRASIQADGVSEYMSATVMFSQIQAISGNFATYCQTDEDVIYIYSKTDAGTITIPAVSCDLSVNYINVDNVPTEDSQAVITSGGVYDALEDKLTKDAELTDNHLLKWDATNAKAIDSGKVISDFEPALTVSTGTIPYGTDRSSGTIRYYKYGRICTLIFTDIVMSSTGYNKVLGTVPANLLPYVNTAGAITKSDATNTSLVTVLSGTGVISGNMNQTATYYGTLTYITAQ